MTQTEFLTRCSTSTPKERETGNRPPQWESIICPPIRTGFLIRKDENITNINRSDRPVRQNSTKRVSSSSRIGQSTFMSGAQPFAMSYRNENSRMKHLLMQADSREIRDINKKMVEASIARLGTSRIKSEFMSSSNLKGLKSTEIPNKVVNETNRFFIERVAGKRILNVEAPLSQRFSSSKMLVNTNYKQSSSSKMEVQGKSIFANYKNQDSGFEYKSLNRWTPGKKTFPAKRELLSSKINFG